MYICLSSSWAEQILCVRQNQNQRNETQEHESKLIIISLCDVEISSPDTVDTFLVLHNIANLVFLNFRNVPLCHLTSLRQTACFQIQLPSDLARTLLLFVLVNCDINLMPHTAPCWTEGRTPDLQQPLVVPVLPQLLLVVLVLIELLLVVLVLLILLLHLSFFNALSLYRSQGECWTLSQLHMGKGRVHP